MKKYFPVLILTCCLFPMLINAQKRIELRENWRFTLDDPADAALVACDDSGWELVTLPHDWAVEGPFDPLLPANTGKLPWQGVGWYRTDFMLMSGIPTETVYLVCEGIMAFPEIYVNGQLAGKWDYGYNSFYLDITGLVNKEGANVVAIRADTRAFDSRWYPGAGIFRKIRLQIHNPIHHELWATWVRTPVIHSDSALVHVENSLVNRLADTGRAELKYRILDREGNEVAQMAKAVDVPGEGQLRSEDWLKVRKPELWDVDHPYLYTLESALLINGAVSDWVSVKFGIRTCRFTPDDGFHLNGRRVQLKGVNLHHDHGPLGAKFYPRAMERQLVMMMNMGVNAIRNSHNIAAPEVLELCDSLGLIFFNEIFDKWDAKAGYLPGMDFDGFAERNVRNWVMRDRNHPCVVLWSVGNEMGDIQYNINGGFDKLNKMISLVRKYDPTRPVTMVCDAKGSAPWRHFDYYDVHAWNYGRRYLPARTIEPNKSVIISESASTLSTRGFYELPLPDQKTDFTRSLQVSSYDLNAPEWAEVADDDFMWQEEDTYVAGEFVWTGFDYLGEPTPYNDEAVRDGFIKQEQSAKSSYFGIVDLCGIPKDRYYLYKSYWKPDESTVHILPHWNWEGSGYDKLPVFVYTNGDCAELFVNGQSKGKRCKQPDAENSTERYRLMWMDVDWQPGELKAVAYHEGAEIGSAVVRTAGAPHHLQLSPDRVELQASGTDLAYVMVEALDDEGNPCPLANDLVEFDIKGPASIEGVGNGDPQSLEPFIADRRRLFYGKAMVIIRTGGEPGAIRLRATAKGLKAASLTLTSK